MNSKLTKRKKYAFENVVKFLIGMSTGFLLSKSDNKLFAAIALLFIILYSWFAYYAHSKGRKDSGAKCNLTDGICKWAEYEHKLRENEENKV